MFRVLTLLLNGVLLGLASGVVPLARVEPNDDIRSADKSDFLETTYAMGAFSPLIATTLLGRDIRVEGPVEAWKCHLEFGSPAENFSNWIHSVDLVCEHDSELVVFPLGEGEFKRAYTRGRLLIKGEAAEALLDVLEKNTDVSSVESPVSSRTIAWGPERSIEILTLRRSDIAANLKFSLECYKDAENGQLHSCALAL